MASDFSRGQPALSQKGFTLIELLVVMSLLSIIMVAMSGTFRTMAQTEIRVDERLQRNDQMRVVNSFLTKVLTRVDAVKTSSPLEPRIEFAANADSLSWTGIMPARHGAGGRYFFHLALEELPTGVALVLRYTPWSAQKEFPDWSQSESHTLATQMSSFLVEAEGLPSNIQTIPPTWPKGWQTGWPIKDATPQRLRLMLADAKGAWPPLVIALMPTLQSQPVSGGFVVGGT